MSRLRPSYLLGSRLATSVFSSSRILSPWHATSSPLKSLSDLRTRGLAWTQWKYMRALSCLLLLSFGRLLVLALLPCKSLQVSSNSSGIYIRGHVQAHYTIRRDGNRTVFVLPMRFVFLFSHISLPEIQENVMLSRGRNIKPRFFLFDPVIRFRVYTTSGNLTAMSPD